MPPPLKTLFLLEDLCYGGTQKQNLALAARLDRGHFLPQVLTLTGATDLDNEVLEADIPLRHLGLGRRVAPLFFVKMGRALAQIRPDILICCTALPNIWGRIWGRKLRVPLIVGSCRGGGAPRRQHEWLLWRLAHGMVCNSLPLLTTLASLGMPQERLCHIANGVDTEHFRPAATTTRNIVCVARLAQDKDHATLLRAFDLVAAKFPETRLQLVGEGPEEDNLRRMAAASPFGSRIDFPGATADPLSWLQQSAVFALTSLREGLPNAILEAMACALPVCATAVGGIPSLVTDNGLLCAPGDAQTLAANLARLLNNSAECQNMGQKGRERVLRDYSFAAMVQKHEEFFLRLWQRKPDR